MTNHFFQIQIKQDSSHALTIPQTPSSVIIKYLKYFLVGLIALSLAGCASRVRSSRPESTPANVKSAPPAPAEVVKVDVRTLLRRIIANSNEANTALGGRTVSVSGIGTALRGAPFIEVTTDDIKGRVICGSEDEPLELNKIISLVKATDEYMAGKKERRAQVTVSGVYTKGEGSGVEGDRVRVKLAGCQVLSINAPL